MNKNFSQNSSPCCSIESKESETGKSKNSTPAENGEHSLEKPISSHVLTDRQRRELVRLVVSGALFFTALIWNYAWPPSGTFGVWALRAILALPYVICGVPVFRGIVVGLRHHSYFNEFSLMGIATIAAIGLGEFPEAVGVMFFYSIGEFLQDVAVSRSKSSISSLLASRPTKARIQKEDGSFIYKEVEEVELGEVISVRPGESIPLDGTVLGGESNLDTSPITGESIPVQAAPSSKVMAGYINKSGLLVLKVTSAFKDTEIARILYLVEEASVRKTETERFVTRFARVYTPIVLALSLIVAIAPPLLFGGSFKEWIYRALVLLVISCPCALVVSVPLGYFSGMGGAARRGILIKGSLVIDSLKKVTTIVFDKTGTLTKGSFSVNKVFTLAEASELDIIGAAAIAESQSNHPIALSIFEYASAKYAGSIDIPTNIKVIEWPGLGMETLALASNNGGSGEEASYLAGNAALMQKFGLTVPEIEQDLAGAIVYVAKNNALLGYILVSDNLKPSSKETISALKTAGFKTFMLTGDREEAAQKVAKAIQVDGYMAGLLPSGKVEALQLKFDPQTVAFVGDGINDAPVLALSGVGIAMGGLGSQAAVEESDAVILNDDPAKVLELLTLAKKVRGIIWQNIGLSLGVKVIIMALGIAGLSGLWEAIFADVGVALLAVLNSLRASSVIPA